MAIQECTISYCDGQYGNIHIKVCSICKIERKISSFQIYRNPTGNVGRLASCTYCKKKRLKDKPYYNDKRLLRNTRIKTLYGITVDEYDRMFAEQGGKCAICKTSDCGREGSTNFSIDHDHLGSKKVRGLLCAPCNKALGLIKDNIDTLYSMIEYLEKHKQDT